MFSDDGFERSLLSERGGIFGAQTVQTILGFGFFAALRFDQLTRVGNLFCQSCDALGDGFKFQGELSALPAEGFDLRVRCCHFSLQTLGLAIDRGQTLFGLR